MDTCERWMNLDEISEYIGCSKDAIRNWIKKDSIPFYKVGHCYKFKLPEIDEWIKSGRSADLRK